MRILFVLSYGKAKGHTDPKIACGIANKEIEVCDSLQVVVVYIRDLDCCRGL